MEIVRRVLILCLLLCAFATSALGQQVSSVGLSPNPAPGGGIFTGTVTISKSAGSSGFKINLTSGTTSVATVPASVTVASGKTSATFTGTALTVSAAGTSKITGTDPNKKTASATLTVDPPAIRLKSLSLSPTTVVASATSTGTVTLTAAAGASGLAVKLTSSKSYATVPTSVTVASGKTTATFTVKTTTVPANESTSIAGKDPNGYGASANLTIDLPAVRLTAFTISPSTVNPAATATGKLTLSANAPTGGLKVTVASNQSDVQPPATVTVAAGKSTATFTIKTSKVTSTTKATLTATDPDDYAATANLTVDLPAVRLTGLSISPTTVTAANAAKATVTLSANAPTGGYAVKVTTGQTYIDIPATVTVPAGKNTATFVVATEPVSTAGTATVTATDTYGYSANANLIVKVPTVRVTGLSISPTSVNSGTDATGTLTLSANAGSGGFTATLSTMQSYVSFPMTVTVAAGSKTATFMVETSTVATSSTATIHAADSNGYFSDATLTVTTAPPTVTMTDNLTFTPKTLTVPAGTTVEFVNPASAHFTHAVLSDVSSQGMNSGPMGQGATYMFTIPANTPSGTTFYYHCPYHGTHGNGNGFGGGMVGVIVVQ